MRLEGSNSGEMSKGQKPPKRWKESHKVDDKVLNVVQKCDDYKGR